MGAFQLLAEVVAKENHSELIAALAGGVVGSIVATVGLQLVENSKRKKEADEKRLSLYALLLLELADQQPGISLDLDALLPHWLTRLDKISASRHEALPPLPQVRNLQGMTAHLHRLPHKLYDEFFPSMVSSSMGPTIYLHYRRVLNHNQSFRDHPQGYPIDEFRDLIYSLGILLEGTVKLVKRILDTHGMRSHLTIDHDSMVEIAESNSQRYEFLAALCRTDLDTLRDLENGLPSKGNVPQIIVEDPEKLRQTWIRRAEGGS